MLVSITLLTALASLGTTAGPGPAGPQEPSILGGQPVEDGRWPDVAGVVYAGGVVGCAGTLIADNLVLTAEHCLRDQPTHVALDTPSLDRPGEVIAVLGTWRAPAGIDAAVLVLAESATIAPRLIARGCASDAITAAAPATVVGYGAIDRDGTDWENELRAVDVTIVDPLCRDLELGCRDDVPAGTELLAGGAGVDACRGDSGGPLYLRTAHGDYLAGVVARGVDAESVCGEGGIYVRADALVPLIEEAFARALPTPNCRAPSEGDAEPMGDIVGGCQSMTSPGLPAALGVLAVHFALIGWRRRRVTTPAR